MPLVQVSLGIQGRSADPWTSQLHCIEKGRLLFCPPRRKSYRRSTNGSTKCELINGYTNVGERGAPSTCRFSPSWREMANAHVWSPLYLPEAHMRVPASSNLLGGSLVSRRCDTASTIWTMHSINAIKQHTGRFTPCLARKSKSGTGVESAVERRQNEPKVKTASKKRSKQKKQLDEEDEDEEEEVYEWPRLICCFGEAMNDFVPTVRVSEKRQDPDIYSTWKMLQWKPPEFARILGGPSYNMAIALARQECRVALMGKVGDDQYGRELVRTLNVNRVQTRGVRFDSKVRTGISELNILCEDGKTRMSCVQPSAENSFMESEINVDILKEALIFHFTSSTLITEPIRSSLFTALGIFKSSGGDIFFDVNLPLPLWISQEHTWSVIKDAWYQANFIEVTKHELEFLLGEESCRRRPPQYAANSEREMFTWRDEYHYPRECLAPVWHDNLKMLIVTDGTYVIHYYTSTFDGEVLGVEDVIVAAYTCDRAGSADAIAAGVIKKLNLHPEIYKDEVTLPKALRYAMSAGVIAQWTPGSTKGLPTESAAQNLTEQLYHPHFVQSIGTELYATRSEEYIL